MFVLHLCNMQILHSMHLRWVSIYLSKFVFALLLTTVSDIAYNIPSVRRQVYSLFIFHFRMPVSDSLVPFVQAGGPAQFGADFAASLDDGEL